MSSKDVAGLCWSVGDLVLAQLGKYPHWPSIIIKNSEGELRAPGKGMLIKVRFFNDNKRVSWISSKKIRPLEASEDYLRKIGTVQKKKCNAVWQEAFKEAARILGGDEGFLKEMLDDTPPLPPRLLRNTNKKFKEKPLAYWTKFCIFLDCQFSLRSGEKSADFIQDVCQKWLYVRAKDLQTINELDQSNVTWGPHFDSSFYRKAMEVLLEMVGPEELPPLPPPDQ